MEKITTKDLIFKDYVRILNDEFEQMIIKEHSHLKDKSFADVGCICSPVIENRVFNIKACSRVSRLN